MKRYSSRTWMVFCGLLAACGADATVDVLGGGEASDRIVGGSPFGELPAVGALVYQGGQHCTGTLISARKVVTAAHCLVDVEASQMRFVIGNKITNPQYSLTVSSLRPHPSYDPYAMANDIGYLTLSADAPIAPLPVLASMGSDFVGTSLLFVGYGVTNGYTQSGAGTKRAVWMDVSSVASTTFSYADSGRNTCFGDSGGPAFHRDAAGNYLVAGVTSYGDEYCTDYGVDTRVDKYLGFLGVAGTVPGATSGGSGSATAGAGTTNDPCGGETYAGRCNGGSVIWCENQQVYTESCASKGLTCVYDSANQYYGCGGAAVADPCQGETFAGRCQGTKVIWCEEQQVKSIDCATSGGVCGLDAAAGYYNCM